MGKKKKNKRKHHVSRGAEPMAYVAGIALVIIFIALFPWMLLFVPFIALGIFKK